MSAYKYMQLINGGVNVTAILRSDVSALQMASVRAIGETFFKNIQQIALFSIMPNEVAFQVRRDQLFTENALFLTEGRRLSTLDEVINVEYTPEIGREINRQMQEHEASPLHKHMQWRLFMGTRYVEGMLDVNAGMQNSVRAMLSLIMIQTWTCFECMAEDLLLSSLREHASRFVLSGAEEWKFRSRRAIRNSYRRAFQTDYATIETAIRSDGVEACALLRNVLVHKAGITDKDFREGAATCPLLAPFRALNDGTQIELNGELVRSIFDPLVKASGELLKGVDNWLAKA